MKLSRSLLVVGVLVVAATVPAFAHHSFSAVYDVSKTAVLTGTVIRLEWINPHARIFLEVKGADGKVMNWEIELAPPGVLTRLGWDKVSLKAGDTITVNGALAKDGSKLASARSVTFADGTTLVGPRAAEFSTTVR